MPGAEPDTAGAGAPGAGQGALGEGHNHRQDGGRGAVFKFRVQDRQKQKKEALEAREYRTEKLQRETGEAGLETRLHTLLRLP